MQSNFWAGSNNFGPAQNILGPVKGQGIKGQGIKGQGNSICPKIYSYLYFRIRNCWQWPTSFGVWCWKNYILLVKKNPWSDQTDSWNFVNFTSIFSQGCHLGVFNPRKNSWSPWFAEEICSWTQTNSYRVRLVLLTAH